MAPYKQPFIVQERTAGIKRRGSQQLCCQIGNFIENDSGKDARFDRYDDVPIETKGHDKDDASGSQGSVRDSIVVSYHGWRIEPEGRLRGAWTCPMNRGHPGILSHSLAYLPYGRDIRMSP